MTSTVAFPTTSATRPNSIIASKPAVTTNFTNMSMVSLHATALEVCHSVYGDDPVSLDTIDRFYEASASECRSAVPRITLLKLFSSVSLLVVLSSCSTRHLTNKPFKLRESFPHRDISICDRRYIPIVTTVEHT